MQKQEKTYKLKKKKKSKVSWFQYLDFIKEAPFQS